jgi:hypothetical protein
MFTWNCTAAEKVEKQFALFLARIVPEFGHTLSTKKLPGSEQVTEKNRRYEATASFSF